MLAHTAHQPTQFHYESRQYIFLQRQCDLRQMPVHLARILSHMRYESRAHTALQRPDDPLLTVLTNTPADRSCQSSVRATIAHQSSGEARYSATWNIAPSSQAVLVAYDLQTDQDTDT